MESFTRNEVTIAYYLIGTGKPVVFLHGFPDSSEIWRKQAEAFAHNGYHAIVPDLRGFGRSSKPSHAAAYRLSEAARDIYALLEHLDVKEFDLIGHDWGAAVSWVIASTMPQRVHALAVLSTGHALAVMPAGGNLQRQRSWYCLFFKLPEAVELLRADDWALWRKIREDDPHCVEDHIKNLSGEGALQAGLGWYRDNISPEWYAMTSPQRAPKLPMPVLGIWSDGDCFLTEEQMTGSARFVEDGKFSYRRLDGCGHWMQLQAPDTINRMLLDFIEATHEKHSAL